MSFPNLGQVVPVKDLIIDRFGFFKRQGAAFTGEQSRLDCLSGLGQALGFLFVHVFDLDDVPPELRAHRLADFTGLHGERFVGERLDHAFSGEGSQKTAILAVRVFRVLIGQFSEALLGLPGPLINFQGLVFLFGHNRLFRIFVDLDQNMPGLDGLFAFEGFGVFIVVLGDILFRDRHLGFKRLGIEKEKARFDPRIGAIIVLVLFEKLGDLIVRRGHVVPTRGEEQIGQIDLRLGPVEPLAGFGFRGRHPFRHQGAQPVQEHIFLLLVFELFGGNVILV